MNIWHHRFVLSSILNRADRILTVSECSKRDIVRFFPFSEAKVSVVYNGVDKAYCPNPAGSPTAAVELLPRPYILNVGTLEPRKNLDGLLRAFAMARRKGMLHTLVITGASGWGKTPLAALVRELELEQAVIFTGFVDDADLPHLYAGADFFVYPSLYEGFGLPVLEAMASGVPVITSNVSSLPEVAGDAALLVDPRSVGELGAAMLKLASDDELRRAMSHRGIERAGMFSWQKAAQETMAIYERVVHGG